MDTMMILQTHPRTIKATRPERLRSARSRLLQWAHCVQLGLVALFLFTSPLLAAETGTASFYDTEACHVNPTKGCPTASGRSLYELKRKRIDFCASWHYPFGTRLRVTNAQNSKSVLVVVLDRGPAKRLGRVCDLCTSAFKKIGDTKQGLIKIKAEVVP